LDEGGYDVLDVHYVLREKGVFIMCENEVHKSTLGRIEGEVKKNEENNMIIIFTVSVHNLTIIF
jgi:hypothetical protein